MEELAGWPVSPGDGGPLLTVAGITVACLMLTVYYFFRSKVPSLPSPLRGSSDTEVIIVGSGVLGSAMATALGRAGRSVTVIERDLRPPQRVVGELLQPGGVAALTTLGLDECLDGYDSQVVHGYVIHEEGCQVDIPFPEHQHRVQAGRAFHHGQFVAALRRAAMAEPTVQYMEGSVSRLVEEDGVVTGVVYRGTHHTTSTTLRAALIVVADGCFSRLRRHLVTEQATIKSHMAAVLMTDYELLRPHYAELVLTDTGPVLVYPISSSDTRVLVDVRGAVPRDTRSYLSDHVLPQLPGHMQDAFAAALLHSSIKTMPGSYLPPAPILTPGVMCLGDAFNMRHPLTGGGMSVALHDVIIATRLLAAVPDLADHSRVMAVCRALYHSRRSSHAFVVNVLSMALYELFAAQDDYLRALKKACFAYFNLGGECVAGPVSLLSVLEPSPVKLVLHFFAVVLYAVYTTLSTAPWYSLPSALGTTVTILWRACGVLLPLIWAELKHLYPQQRSLIT